MSPRDNLLLALHHEPPGWLPCPTFDGSVLTVGHGVAESAPNGPDSWGVVWQSRHERSASFPVTHPLSSPDQLEDYPFPSVGDGTFASTRRALENADRSRVAIMGDNGWGLFERAWLLLGMGRFFRWAHDYPDSLQELVARIAAVKMEITRGLVEVGVDIVAYGDDWGMEGRLLMRRGIWMEFIAPWQSKLYKAAGEGGCLVYQHSDGRVEALVPEIARMGADILNIQRECNDWPGIIARERGSVTMWGGVSARTLDLGTHQEITREVVECCRLGRQGGVVLAPGHSIKYLPGKLAAMRDAWKEMGKYRSLAQG